MEKKNHVLKYISIPFIILILCLSPCVYMAWKEIKIQNVLVDQALLGNRCAIHILAKYEKPWRLDEKIVYEAMKGNPYALEILKIKD